MENVHGPVHGFSCGGTRFEPVAVVPVLNAVDPSEFRTMDMATNDAVIACSMSGLRHGFSEPSVGFGALLQRSPGSSSQRPRSHTQAMANPSHGPVNFHENLTSKVAEMTQYLAVPHEQVELVAVNHPQTTAVCSGVHGVSLNGYSVDGSVGPSPKTVIMIPRDVDDLGAAFGFLHEVSENVVAVFVPRPLPSQDPLVNDVADEVNRFGVVRLKKGKQFSGFDTVQAEVPVGKEEGPVVFRRNLQMLPSSTIGSGKK